MATELKIEKRGDEIKNRQFGSTIQFFLISNQAVLSGEAGYRQKFTSI
jgi:hypothetical protein